MDTMERVLSASGRCLALLPLLILPAMAPAQGMSWSTLMGGDRRDVGTAVAVDDRGFVTVAGGTESTIWPYPQPAGIAGVAGFLARFDPSLAGSAQLVWCTVLDGHGWEFVCDMSMTPDGGSITAVGVTMSSNLPCTLDAYQSVLRGPVDGFVMQLDGSGAITYCSYFGGDDIDWIYAVERDAAGRLVLVGSTTSNELSFPVAPGAFDTTYNGNQDSFVAIFDPTLPGTQQVVSSTYLGGGGRDGCVAFSIHRGPNLAFGDVAIAADGSIVVTAATASADFPVTSGAFQTTNAGGADDMYVSRLDPALSSLQYSTYLGGGGSDSGVKLALRGALDVYVAGGSDSTNTAPFPTSPWAVQTASGGSLDAVLVWLHTAGLGAADLQYSTLLGSWNIDAFADLTVADSGVITAAGTTYGGLTATPGALQPISSPRDSLLVRIDPAAIGQAGLHYLSFLSGSGAPFGEEIRAMALHGDGLLTLAGFTDAAAFPTTPGALQATNNGLFDAFVTTIDPLPAHAVRIGRSTPACRGPIWLQVDSDPAPGNSAFTVLGNGAPPGAVGAVVVGPIATPPIPVLNAALLVFPAASVFAFADQHGAWRLPLPLPANLAFPAGLGLQWLWLTAPHCNGSGPLGASHALAI